MDDWILPLYIQGAYLNGMAVGNLLELGNKIHIYKDPNRAKTNSYIEPQT